MTNSDESEAHRALEEASVAIERMLFLLRRRGQYDADEFHKLGKKAQGSLDMALGRTLAALCNDQGDAVFKGTSRSSNTQRVLHQSQEEKAAPNQGMDAAPE